VHRVAYVFNPALTPSRSCWQTVSDEFGLKVPAGASVKTHVDVLNAFLLGRHAEGRSCLLVIDEAQALSSGVLEQLRLLTNLETDDAQAAADRAHRPARAARPAGQAEAGTAVAARDRARAPGAAGRQPTR
jgi:hypothetical protein